MDGERELVERFPADQQAILGYRTHFSDTLTGMVPGTGAIVAELIKAGVRVVALTNWSAETFPYAQRRFGILKRFEDILVSGIERIVKPDPAIFELALERFGLPAEGTVFVDDSGRNVEAAAAVGLTARRFTDAETFRADLVELGLLEPRRPLTESIFHIADRQAWAELEAGGRYPWSSRGLSYDAQGFVHCSFAAQLPAVLDAHYADVAWSELILLELDPAGLPVVVEDLGAGPFPHLYAELEQPWCGTRHQAWTDRRGRVGRWRTRPGGSTTAWPSPAPGGTSPGRATWWPRSAPRSSRSSGCTTPGPRSG